MNQTHTALLLAAALTIFITTTAPLRITVAAGLLGLAFEGTALGLAMNAVGVVAAVVAVLHAAWHLLPRRQAKPAGSVRVELDTRFEIHGTEAAKSAFVKAAREVN